jgi:ribonuclease Z
MKVTLLDAGTPIRNINRFGMSTRIEAGGQRLWFDDAGRSVAIRLHQAEVPLRDSTAVFLTQLHSDHLMALPDFYATAPLGFDSRRALPLDVWGPQGITTVGYGLALMFTENNCIRLATSNNLLQMRRGVFFQGEL